MYTLCVQLHNSSAVTLITLHFHEHYKREYTAIVICYSVPLMCFIISPVTAAVSDERRCSAHLFLVEVPAHHSAPSSSALAEGFRADCIQTVSPRVQVSTRVRTCIPYRRALSGGRCRGSSATPFQYIFIIDCQPHPTPYCRWPSFPGHRCTCLKTHLFNISYPCDCSVPAQWL